MKRAGILLIFAVIILGGIIFGQEGEIVLGYPATVVFSQPFNISISLNNFEEGVYDAKFELVNESKNIGKRYYEDTWKSTNYWMEGAINTSQGNTKEFLVMISELYEGTHNFSVKVRGQTGSIVEQQGVWTINGRNTSENETTNQAPRIRFEWDEDTIKNGDEFLVTVNVLYLEDKSYDVRIWIDDDGTVISDRYDPAEENWKSGMFYLDNFMHGPDEEEKKIKLRIREGYKDFSGDARIFFKLRDGFLVNKSISILKKDLDEELAVIVPEQRPVTGNVVEKIVEPQKSIRLGEAAPLQSKEYISFGGLVKRYAMYAFALLCVVISILIVSGKLN